jgi:hypothetical protein
MAAAVALSTVVAVAGCGGSGKNTGSTGNSAAASGTTTASSTPTTSSTPPTSSSPAASNSGHVSKSARVASSAYYAFTLAVTHNTAPYLNASQARFAAHCIQKRFLASGFKTQADVEKATHTSGQKVRDILSTCFLNGRYH